MGSQPLPRLSSFSDSEIQALQETLRDRFSFLKRCKWALMNGKKITDLTTELSTHNHTLNLLCPDGAHETLKLNFLVEYLWSHVSPAGLLLTKNIATEMASHGDPASSHLYDALADLAPLKGSATHLSETLSNHQRRKLLNLQDECFQIRNQDDPSTMAVWSKEVDDSTVKEAVFIEFKSYRNHDGDRDDKVRDDVLRLGKLLHDPKTPVRLHTRTCYGLTEDIDKGRIGFVYKLPWRLDVRGSHAQKARALTRQMPCSLESVIKTEQAPPLGDRFGLAKKLLEGVMLMHATGWVHKNIRSTSIMFFRKCPVSRSTPPFNWESPYLMGWGFSRSENLTVNVTRGSAEVGGSTQEHRIELDIYQHPDKRMDPYRRYQHAYDIYSLGLVLLELGL